MARTNKAPLLRRVDAIVRDHLTDTLGAPVSRGLVRFGWLVDLRFNLSLAHAGTWRGRLDRMVRATRHAADRTWVLFRPDIPEYRHIVYKICLLLGYRITEDPTKSFGVAIKWKDATFPDRDACYRDWRLTTRC